MAEYQVRYRPMDVMVDDLSLGEGTVHRCGRGDQGPVWWLLWMCVTRDTDGQEVRYCVPVAPNGDYDEKGAGGKTWGLRRDFGMRLGTWRVSPSVNVLLTEEVHPGEHREVGSQWHKNVVLVEVPDGEPWQTEPA